ncbi:hypothetical protein BO70DRAFT_395794 [Aspergillus heteromorphus CBS 117.55]|uniref:Uncharacterized protein n=1 Tax=Aspergillus heteromorphus CBS 117.55 TaxID=1448321 RepID=A0A317W9S8_9EURO|nr:uncharacterized protein BO70DRAFT_395794 [Aspergillus heteromorphus CBS 117.55]PWY83346.1 hypothetical protein BO70DRAFT_395794 [Aspergillus heteromorphus CBS 117.55]
MAPPTASADAGAPQQGPRIPAMRHSLLTVQALPSSSSSLTSSPAVPGKRTASSSFPSPAPPSKKPQPSSVVAELRSLAQRLETEQASASAGGDGAWVESALKILKDGTAVHQSFLDLKSDLNVETDILRRHLEDLSGDLKNLSANMISVCGTFDALNQKVLGLTRSHHASRSQTRQSVQALMELHRDDTAGCTKVKQALSNFDKGKPSSIRSPRSFEDPLGTRVLSKSDTA